MAISALQRQQDWGTQYLDDSGQWMQDDGAVGPGATAANDENGMPSTADSSASYAALRSAVMSAAASALSGGAIAAAQGDTTAVAEPIKTIDTPDRQNALSVDASVDKDRSETTFTAPPPDIAPDSLASAIDPAVAPDPAQAPDIAPVAPGDHSADEWAAITTAWTGNQGNFYRLYQQMDEHGWTAADIAHVSGMTEQEVGDYMTRGGAPAGFGGAVTLGRDAVDAPYLAALAAAQADPPSQPDASRPWWTVTTPPPGAAFNEAGQIVDESGNVQPTASFSLAAFTSWYQSQATPEAQNFARIHGAFTADANGGLHFGAGAVLGAVSYTEAGAIAAPALSWAMDKRITEYAGYAKGDAFTIDAMRGMVDTPQNQQIIQVFGGAPVALPENEMGERMRAMYGSDLAAKMLQLTAATDAMKARYLGDLNAAISAPGAAGAGQALAPWWTLDAPPPTQYGENGLQVDESGQPIPQYSFNAAAFHAWYVAQPDAANQLIGQVYGTETAGDAGSYRTTGATDSLSIQVGLDENGHATRATDVTLSNDLVRVNLADPEDMFENGAVYFLPTQGFVTSKDNIKPDTDFWDQIIPMIIVAAVSYFSAGTLGPATAVAMGLGQTAATLTTAGLIVSAAVAGAATSMVSGMLNDNLSLKGILQGALAGGLTAGLTSSLSSLSSLSSMGPAAGIATRGTIQGCVQAIMGGSFKDGMIAGLASGVSEALSTNINSGVVAGLKNGTMTAAGAITARYCASMLGSAIRIVATGSGAPGYAAAQAFLDSTFQQAGAPADMLPATNPALVGTTGQSLPAVAGDGSNETVTVVESSESQAQAQRDAETARLDAQSDFRMNEIAQQNADAQAQQAGGQPALPTSSPEDALTAFRQSELASRAGTNVAGSGHVAQSGDNISRIVGTSDPQAIGNFIRANNLTSSTLQVGRNYFVPVDTSAYGDSAALGQAVLDGDNSRLAELATQRAAQQQAYWDSLRQGAWSNRTGNGVPVWHVSAPVASGTGSTSSSSAPAMVEQDAYTAAGDYAGTTMVPIGTESPRDVVGETVKGIAIGVARTIAEPILQVGDLLQVGNEIGRSLVTGEAPRDINYLSMVGQAAGQGATTTQIVNGGVQSLLTTPDRIIDSYRSGDYQAMGEDIGALGVGAAGAAAGLRGSLPDIRMGAQLFGEDLASSGTGQRLASTLDQASYRLGTRTYVVPPSESTSAVVDALPNGLTPRATSPDLLPTRNSNVDGIDVTPSGGPATNSPVIFNATLGRNTVSWTVDSTGETVSASGTLRDSFSKLDRSSAEVAAQTRAANSGLDTDQGGHLSAHRFVGDQGLKNLFPQDANFNMSAFKTIENDYARYTAKGYRVDFNHTLGDFDPTTRRPGSVSVSFEVTDAAGQIVDTFSQKFTNQPGQLYTRRAR